MAAKPDAEKILTTLAELWCHQYGMELKSVEIMRTEKKGEKEKCVNSSQGSS